MHPVHATDEHVDFWTEKDDGHVPKRVTLGGPAEGPDVIPCPALIASEVGCVHVAYQLDEIELAALAQGGTLWLTTWGMVPVHLLEVQPAR